LGFGRFGNVKKEGRRQKPPPYKEGRYNKMAIFGIFTRAAIIGICATVAYFWKEV
jgi:hypothetical protein